MKCKTIGIGMLLTGLAFTCQTNAQEPTSSEAGSSEVVVETAMEKIESFLASKGWAEGPNKGGKLHVTTGIGIVLAKPGSKNYLNSRNNAFKKALLNAKVSMTTWLGETLSAKLETTLSEPALIEEQQSDAEEASGKEGELGMWDKAELLLHSELDEMLSDRGVDLNTDEGKEKAKEEVKTLMETQGFKESVAGAARNEVAGLTAYKIFECQSPGEQGEIAVVCVYSEKTREMANALLGKGGVPEKKKAKQPLKDQINKDMLVCTYGVQQRIDENGDVAILSFGHGIPRSKTRSSMSIAMEKAIASAKGEIRRFAGEMVAVNSTMDSAETYDAFESASGEMSDVYSSLDSYEKNTSSVAKDLDISGVNKLFQKEVTHPLTKQKFVVVVMEWSPTDADQANALRGTLAKMRGSEGGSGRTKTKPARDVATGESDHPSLGGSDEGQEGDDDAFE